MELLSWLLLVVVSLALVYSLYRHNRVMDDIAITFQGLYEDLSDVSEDTVEDESDYDVMYAIVNHFRMELFAKVAHGLVQFNKIRSVRDLVKCGNNIHDDVTWVLLVLDEYLPIAIDDMNKLVGVLRSLGDVKQSDIDQEINTVITLVSNLEVHVEQLAEEYGIPEIVEGGFVNKLISLSE